MTGVQLDIRDLTKVYQKADATIRVLDGVNMSLDPGEMVVLVGASGTGKSTFLHLLGMLDRPTHGEVLLDGVDVFAKSEARRVKLRNRRIGFVFQSHNLLAGRTALGNVMVPVRLAGGTRAVAVDRATQLLEAVGLGHRLAHLPGELSGGEQQRVALARALVMGPGLVLADEPTGNLDPSTAKGVFDLMLQLNEQAGSTLVVVTHSRQLADRFTRKLLLADNRFAEI